jgi:hypothetical protein
MHPILGWCGSYYSTLDPASIIRFVENVVENYDVVIWGAIYGLKSKGTEGRTDWVRMFSETAKHGVRHVAMLRDDHFWKRQGWAAALEPWIAGWACVQQGTYDTADGLSKPRAIIYSPHKINEEPFHSYDKRTSSVFSVQTAKPWKRVDRLVAAVPHMRVSSLPAQIILAGDGIDLRYMRSPTKPKPRHVCTEKVDPDATNWMANQSIWDNANRCAAFDYLGPISEEQRDLIMSNVKGVIDLSERENTGQVNRVFVEAANRGAIVLGIPQFYSGLNGEGWLFRPGEHYIPLPADCKPKELAGHIEKFLYAMNPEEAALLQLRAWTRIKNFDRKIAATQLLELARGEVTGWSYSPASPQSPLAKAGVVEFNATFGNLSA